MRVSKCVSDCVCVCVRERERVCACVQARERALWRAVAVVARELCAKVALL